MSTWIVGTITAVIDEDTFDLAVERTGGPYAADVRPTERIRFVNREVSSLRPRSGTNFYGRNELVGRRVQCEIHSRSAASHLICTARPI